MANKQFCMSKSYTAMLLRSKFFSNVFDILDSDRIASSFNVFVDCELTELDKMIQIASLLNKKVEKPVPSQIDQTFNPRQKVVRERKSTYSP